MKVNPYDQNAVKQLIDDTVIKILSQEGYIEHTTVSNLKILFGLICCTFALLSHFYPIPFPQNIPLLIVCVCGYFAGSGFLQLLAYFVEKDILYWGGMMESKRSGKEQYTSIEVATRFPKYQDILTIRAVNTGTNKKSEIKESIEKWFDEDGAFAESIFTDDMKQLLNNLHKND